MTRGFRRHRDGTVRCRLAAGEAMVIRQVTGEVEALLATAAVEPAGDPDELEALVGTAAQDPPRPDDPALARLFPDAYADAEQAAEFRRYTQGDLYAEKRQRLAALRESVAPDGGEVTLDAAAAQGWLTALNDVRLTLGSRVEVSEDNGDELAALPDDDPRGALFAVYDFLTFLQETLVHAVARW